MNVLQTPRLILRQFTVDDGEFILELVNDPSWLRYVGDRGVKTLDDARRYLLKGPIEMYLRLGFGLYLVALKSDGTPIGLCGLIKRETLEDVDIGFAFLPRFCSMGYALESAAGVMEYAKSALGLKRVVAITTPDNAASIKLLTKLGMKHEKMVHLAGDHEALMLFASSL